MGQGAAPDAALCTAAAELVKEDVSRYKSELDSILSEMDTLKEVRRGHHLHMLTSAFRRCLHMQPTTSTCRPVSA